MEQLTKRQRSILIGLLIASIDESESQNNWQATPYSQDLKDILKVIESIEARGIGT